MLLQKLIDGCRAILCVDGDLPKKTCFPREKTIVAADGAANKLASSGIMPDVIIGDLDSVDRSKFPQAKIVEVKDQSISDFGKALHYINQNNLGPSLIYGANGGFLDHILTNISIIMANKCNLYAPPIAGFVIENEELMLQLPLNTKISIFGFNALISSKGLKWELQNKILAFPGEVASFNRTTTQKITITASNGKALVLIYEIVVNDCGIK